MGDPQTIIHDKYGGLDADHISIWDAATATTSLFSALKPVRRLVYDSDADVMYLASDVKEQNWGSFLRVEEIPQRSTGNRTFSDTVDLPYEDAEYATWSNYGGGQPAAFSVADDYIFVRYGVGHVRILKKSDGSLVARCARTSKAGKAAMARWMPLTG